MSVVNTDLVIYTSANMPEGNTTIAGGDINSGIRASYDDPSSPNQIVVYSSSASDTSQNLTLVGRTAAGIDINESLSLNGTANITTSYIYERILKANLSDVTVGIITVSGNSINKIADIPIGESGFRRPFYDATASADVAKTYYEKIFVKNNNSTSALTEAKVTEINLGLASKIEFALEDTKKDDQTIANRESVPTGITGGFGDGPSGIVNEQLLAGDYQGIWCKLSLEAGEPAINSFYEVQISGTTV
jgi:hypothetical protein